MPQQMSKNLKRFKQELARAWNYINSVNWVDPAFSPEKAYVSALFSKVAYLELPDFEVQHHALAKVVPCLSYWHLIARGTRHEVLRFLETIDFGDSFVVTTKHVIAVGIRANNVLFVSLRGTRPLYLSDWMIDFHFARTQTYVDSHAVHFHSGFYLAIRECLGAIASEIQKRNARFEVPVYVVGHSLGGAMAGVSFAVDGLTFYSKHYYGITVTERWGSHSAYSFGMPRYGDARAVHDLRAPFHTYNDRDIVPGVPPRGFGYANVPIEYRTDAQGGLMLAQQGQQGIGWWAARLNLARGVRFHLVERYIRRLGVAIGAY